MVQQAPDGTDHPPTAYVFGDILGGQVNHPKRPWLTACRRAGVTDLHSTIFGTRRGVALLKRAGRYITCRRCWATPT